jgi:hypothetical protein
MAASRIKRIFVVFGLLLTMVMVGAVVLAFMVSRDVPFDWENPNFVEGSEARRKLKLYETSVQGGQRGFLRLSQLEINSHLESLLSSTNESTNAVAPEVDAGPVKLRRVALGLTSTNMMLYSWGETRKFGLPLKFVVQRGLQIHQKGTNGWEISTEFMKIGELEVSRKYWPKFDEYLEALDRPLLDKFSWRTNIQAMAVAKNELSQRQELRLYTYKPIPAADLH